MAKEKEKKEERKPRKRGMTALKFLLSILGLIVVILIVLQIALSPAVLTRIVNKVADNYIDGDVSFGRVSVSMFRNFPNVSVSLDSVSITYPTERYAGHEEASPLLLRGKGAQSDTLASFNHFSVSVNIASLMGGSVVLHSVDLDKPRIYAKSYDEGLANWNIFKTGSGGEKEESAEPEGVEEEVQEVVADAIAGAITDKIDSVQVKEETEKESGGMPDISVGRIRLHNNPVIVFCSVPDSLYATVGLRNMQFRGKLTTKDLYKNKLGFKVDSMYIAGRLQQDTLALGLRKLAIKQNKGVINLDLLAGTKVSTASAGRMNLPISVKSQFSFPKDSVPSVNIQNLEANFAGIPLNVTGDLKYYKDRVLVTANAAVNKCKVKDVIDNFGKNFWPEATNFRTDAVLTLNAFVNGWYYLDGSAIPQVSLSVNIPDTSISNKKMKLNSNIGLAMWARGGAGERVDVGIDDFHFKGNTIQLSFNGSASDLLGEDPDFKVDAALSVGLDSLASFIEKETGMKVNGDVSAVLKGDIKKSQMNTYGFASADLGGFVKTNRLDVVSEKVTIRMHLDSLSVLLGTHDNERDTTIEIGTRLMSAAMKVDSAYVMYKRAMFIHGTNLRLSAWNDASVLDSNDSSAFYPFSGTVKIGSLFMADRDSSRVVLLGSENKFTVKPSPQDKEIPVLTLSTSNKSFRGKMAYNRVAFGDLNVSLTASKSGAKRQKMARVFADSLAKRHPEIPRDSLFNFVRREAGSRQLPDWLTEEDFRKSDLDFKLDETLAKYYREWDFDGSLGLDRAILMTPAMPLRNSLTKVEMTINNEAFTLKNMTVKSGKSDLSARGRLSGLRQGLLNNGTISLNMDINSDNLNLNELLTAYTLGQKITAKLDSLSGAADALDDDEYMDMVAIDTIAGDTAPQMSLLVIPANLNAELKLNASRVAYSILDMDSMHSEITMKERCVQIVNTGATSDIGNLTLEAFYSTQTKEDLKAGFNLALEDVTAEKIVELMPAVDSIMPMVKSFRGNLDCMVAATAQIDTLMNIELPSLNGVLRIKGKDLALVESEDLYKIAKILQFKDVTNIQIDDMSVEALLSDSKVEIFPFILSAGKYKLALSGVQNLDQSFSYHASVIKSPLLIRFGVNFTGPDFEHMKFKIGKAVYKDENVQVFSYVIDQTRLNLSDAIRNIFTKGVDAAVQETREHKEIESRRKELNYVNPVEDDIEDLSDDETAILNEEKFVDNGDPDDYDGNTEQDAASDENEVPSENE